MLPRCIVAIVLLRGDFQEEKWGLGDTDRLPCQPLDLCVHNGAIYEGTVAPFPSDSGGGGSDGGSLVCHRNCCANISPSRVHLLATTAFSAAATSVPTQCRHALHLSNAQRKTQTQ